MQCPRAQAWVPLVVVVAMAAVLPLVWPTDGSQEGGDALNGDIWNSLLSSVPALAASLLAVVLVGTVVLEPMVSLLSHRVDLKAQVVLGLGRAEDGAQAMLIARAAKANYFRAQTKHNWAFGAAVRAGLLGSSPPSPREDVAVAAEAILSAQGSGPDVTDHLSLLSESTLTARVALLAQLFAGTSEGQRLRKAHTMLVAETERLATLLVPVTDEGEEAGEATAERAWGGALRKWQSNVRKGKRHAARRRRGGRAAAPASGSTAAEASPADGSDAESSDSGADDSRSEDSEPSAASSTRCGRERSDSPPSTRLPSAQNNPAEALPVSEESMLSAALDIAADAVLQRWPALATRPPPRDVRRPDESGRGWRDLNRDVAYAFAYVRRHVWATVPEARAALFAPLRAVSAAVAEAGQAAAPAKAAADACAHQTAAQAGSPIPTAWSGQTAGEQAAWPWAWGAEAAVAFGDELWPVGDEVRGRQAPPDAAEERSHDGSSSGDAAVAWARRAAVVRRFRDRRSAAASWVSGQQWALPTLPAWEFHGLEPTEVAELVASMQGARHCLNWNELTPEKLLVAVVASRMAEDASRLLGGAANPAGRAPAATGSAAGVPGAGEPGGQPALRAAAASEGPGGFLEADAVTETGARLTAARRLVRMESLWRPRMASALLRAGALPLAMRLVTAGRGLSASVSPLPLTLSGALLPAPAVSTGAQPGVLLLAAPGSGATAPSADGASGAASAGPVAHGQHGGPAPTVSGPTWSAVHGWVADALQLRSADATVASRPGAVAAARAVAVASGSALFAQRTSEAVAAVSRLAYCTSDGGSGAGPTAMGRAEGRRCLFARALQELEAEAGKAAVRSADSSQLYKAAIAAAGIRVGEDGKPVRAEHAKEQAGGDHAVRLAKPAGAEFCCLVIDTHASAVHDAETGGPSPSAVNWRTVAAAGPLFSLAVGSSDLAALVSTLPAGSVETSCKAASGEQGEGGVATQAASPDVSSRSETRAAAGGIPWTLQRMDGSIVSVRPADPGKAEPPPRFVVVIGGVCVRLPGSLPSLKDTSQPLSTAPLRWALDEVPQTGTIAAVVSSALVAAPKTAAPGVGPDCGGLPPLAGAMVRVRIEPATMDDIQAYAAGLGVPSPGPVDVGGIAPAKRARPGRRTAAPAVPSSPPAAEWVSCLAPPLSGVARTFQPLTLLLPSPSAREHADPRLPCRRTLARVASDAKTAKFVAESLRKSGDGAYQPWDTCSYSRASAAGVSTFASLSEPALAANAVPGEAAAGLPAPHPAPRGDPRRGVGKAAGAAARGAAHRGKDIPPLDATPGPEAQKPAAAGAAASRTPAAPAGEGDTAVRQATAPGAASTGEAGPPRAGGRDASRGRRRRAAGQGSAPSSTIAVAEGAGPGQRVPAEVQRSAASRRRRRLGREASPPAGAAQATHGGPTLPHALPPSAVLNRWRNNDADYGAVSAEDSGIIWRGAVSSPGRSPSLIGDSELLD